MLYNRICKPKNPFQKQSVPYSEDMEKLTENEIQRRSQEWRNIKVLHGKAAERNKKLKKKINTLEEEILKKDRIIFEQLEVLETLQLQVEELRQIVFGRGRKKDDDDTDGDFRLKKENKEKEERSKDSYKRPVPDGEDVTAHEYHRLPPSCPDCGTNLQDKETIVFHEEDIPLPDKKTKLKRVIKHHVEKGWCPACRKWHTAYPLPPAKVILGKNVRLYIIYLSILLRLSFSQIQSALWDTYHFRISDGEIRNILFCLADRLRPEFERIKKRILEGGAVHLDETTWGEGYLWTMAAAKTEDVVYLAGRTRGKGNAEELLGKDFKGVRITDGYPAYDNLPGAHQQCWTHPNTKIKDLACSKAISKKARKHCRRFYKKFSKTYKKLRDCLEEDFDPVKRVKQKKELLREIKKWRKPHAGDPKKLRNVKQQFYDYEPEWLTCMDHKDVPCDNNKAERAIRHQVLKRVISFGNKSKKGHEAFEVLASVLMTSWKTYKDSFFPELRELCA